MLVALVVVALIVGGAVGVSRYKLSQAYRAYPLRYKDLIMENAEVYDLKPWHIASVVRWESSFNATAESGVGARGLMQIMPDTGAWIAGKLDEGEDYTADNLYDPATNLRFGCWYLKWLMNRYHDDVVLTTSAYHAGQGTVDKWLSDPDISPDGQSIAIENIPYDSTRTYVQRVVTGCERYEELYEFDTLPIS